MHTSGMVSLCVHYSIEYKGTTACKLLKHCQQIILNQTCCMVHTIPAYK